MGRENHYRGIIFTNHALQRMGERYLPQEWVYEAFSKPTSSHPAKQSGAYEYRKDFGPSTVTVIAKQNERREWIILSCWIDPPYPGTKDYKQKQNYHAYKKAGIWGKLWITIKSQLGF